MNGTGITVTQPPGTTEPAALLEHDPLYVDSMGFVMTHLPEWAGASVLEIGCGAGAVCGFFAHRAERVVGLDVNQNVLPRGGPRLRARFVCGSGEDLPFADDSFDLVFSRSTLQYMNRAAALREVRRVLRPGGTLVLMENLPSNPIIVVYRLLRRLTHRSGARKQYVDSIRGYITLDEIDRLGDSFTRVDARCFHLSRMLSIAPRRLAAIREVLDPILARVDELILANAPPTRRLAWIVAGVLVGHRKDGGLDWPHNNAGITDTGDRADAV